MMVTTHALVGAAFGEEIHNPYLVFVLMIALHILMDKIPHFWPNTKLAGEIFKWTDILICGLFLLSILIFQPANYVSVFAGAFGGILVDVIFVGIPWVKRSKYGEWQEKRQPHKQETLYISTDLSFSILAVLFLAR